MARKQFHMLAIGGSLFMVQGLAYISNLLASRILGPIDYGIVGSSIAVLNIFSTIAIGLQVATTQFLVGPEESLPSNIDKAKVLSKYARLIVVSLLPILLVSSLLVAWFLDINYLLIVMMTLSIVPMILVSKILGEAQAFDSYRLVISAILMPGVARFVLGILFLLIFTRVDMFFLGLFVGTLIGSLGLVKIAKSEVLSREPSNKNENAILLKRHWLALQSILIFYTLTNMDVVFARITLDPFSAGEYISAALLTKIAFFLPAALAVIYLSRLSGINSETYKYKAILITIAIDIPIMIFTILQPALVLKVIGLSESSMIGALLPGFALLGILFAMIQIIVLEHAGRNSRLFRYLGISVVILGLLLTIIGVEPDAGDILMFIITCSSVVILIDACDYQFRKNLLNRNCQRLIE